MDEIYRLIGIVVHNSQVIEYNLAYGISLHRILIEFEDRESIPNREYNLLEREAEALREELNNDTLGTVIKKVSETKCFKTKVLEALKDVLSNRNYVAHQLFKDGFNPTNQQKVDIKRYLNNVIEDMTHVNRSLVDRIKALENEYNLIT